MGQGGDGSLALTAPGHSVYLGCQLGHWEENARVPRLSFP